MQTMQSGGGAYLVVFDCAELEQRRPSLLDPTNMSTKKRFTTQATKLIINFCKSLRGKQHNELQLLLTNQSNRIRLNHPENIFCLSPELPFIVRTRFLCWTCGRSPLGDASRLICHSRVKGLFLLEASFISVPTPCNIATVPPLYAVGRKQRFINFR